MELPDCEALERDEQLLTDDIRRDVVTRLAEGGVAGLDDYIREQLMRTDSLFSKKVERLRKDLERQQADLQKLMDERLKEGRDVAMQRFDPTLVDIQDERRRLRREGKELKKRRKDELLDLFQSDEVIGKLVVVGGEPVEEPDLPWWKRFLEWLVDLVRRFVAWLKRLFRRLLGRKPEEEKGRRGTVIALPSKYGRDMSGLSLDLSRVSSDPAVMKELFPEWSRWQRFRFRLKQIFRPKAAQRKWELVLKERMDEIEKGQKDELARRREELKQKLQELKERERVAGTDLEKALRKLELDKADAIAEFEKRLTEEPFAEIRRQLVDELEDAGLLAELDEMLGLTWHLIDQFAEICFTNEMITIPAAYHINYGSTEETEGIYERDAIRTIHEQSRIDLVNSVINAHIRHPGNPHLYDDDILVNRERMGAINHVVIAFDKSDSMAENHRILAAKKAVLALYKAIKHKNRRNMVDLIAFDTKVRPVGLVDAWELEPFGFTNTGAAIGHGENLLRASKADKKLLYLITDGLPEAYINDKGENVASDTETCLKYAERMARRLRDVKNMRLIILLLEPEDEKYVDSARRVATAANGSVIATDPQDLAREMLVDFEHETMAAR